MRALALSAVLLLALVGCRTEPTETPEASGVEAESAGPSEVGDSESVDDGAGAAPSGDTSAREASVPLGADGAPDLSALSLTLPRMARWVDAQARLIELTEADPNLKARWASDGVDPTSYPAMLARIEAVPEAVRAVESAGLSPEAFVATGVVYLHAAGASLDPGSGFRDLPGATDANVAFITDNRLAIDSMIVTRVGG
ncbi:MAG: hypothetical protein AAFQ43_07185 [Bacteroidota bacterium]